MQPKTIDPLLKTKWGQGTPYNKNLVFEDKSTLVGCAAIAAGQIIYYWGTKGFHRGCTATPAYTTLTNGYTVKALPSTITFDYKNLTATKPTTDKSKEAVAKLLEYVGKAMYSDYKPNSTTVYTDKIVPALKENFRMGDVKLVNSSTVSEQRFSDIVYDELKLGRPVILFGTGTNGGHFFVCDGYDASTGLFHMNWGWNGSYNGWFAMSALTPTTKNYNSRKRAYIGIAPLYKAGDANKDGEVNITDVTATVNSINSGKYNEGSDINYDGQVTVTDVELLVEGVGSVKKDLLLKSNGQIKIQNRDKFVDLFKDGKIVFETDGLFDEVQSTDEMKTNGIYLFDESIYIKINDTLIKLNGEIVKNEE